MNETNNFINSEILILSMDEKNNVYNSSLNLDNILEIIEKKKFSIIIVNTQESSTKTENHFQHIFTDKLLKNTKYSHYLKKSKSNKATLTFPKFMMNKNLRTRIFINTKKIDSINIENEKIDLNNNYISITLKINNKYIIKNINFFLEIDYKNLENIKDEIDSTNDNINLFLSGFNNNSSNINKINNIESIKNNIMNYLNKIKFSNKINSRNHKKFVSEELKFNFPEKQQKGGKLCMLENNRDVLMNQMAYNNKLPNTTNNVGYYTIIKTLKYPPGPTKEKLLCLLSGLSEGHNIKMPEIYYLLSLKKYINEKENLNNKDIIKINNIIEEIIKNEIKFIKSTIILTNIPNGMYNKIIINNSFFLLMLEQSCKDLKIINNTSNNINTNNFTPRNAIINTVNRTDIINNNGTVKKAYKIRLNLKSIIENESNVNLTYENVKNVADHYGINIINKKTNNKKTKEMLINEIKKNHNYRKRIKPYMVSK
jgi:hypothetical protein